ncbi:hypothetical protein [Bosea sp. ASV33]|uniref:hypothetical protein n=1 Tax=Bosea sp. ASV33 TaxID=2795106 RepID=UPI0018EC6246|nr:hypothetical protein [Bosea sp. ASV33]
MSFAPLEGAALAAEALGEWARAAGYGEDNVVVVTDAPGDGPVTPARVQAAVDQLFAAGREPVDHLLLSYCGHGLAGPEINSAFWLFSDAIERRYRVNVDGFVAELLRFGIGRITLVSDACREGPPTFDLLRYEARRAIDGKGAGVRSPLFDRLSACQDGKRAYMVGDQASALPGKCIFSGVVVDVLWGREAEALDEGSLTTSGLGLAARERATQRAADYGLELYPHCMVDPKPLVLFEKARPPAGDPRLQEWPTAASASALGAELPAVARSDVRKTFERIVDDEEFRARLLGFSFAKGSPHFSGGAGFRGLPGDAKPVVEDLLKLEGIGEAGAGSEKAATVRRLEGKAVAHARRQSAADLRASASTAARWRPENGGRSANLRVHGFEVISAWSELAVRRLDKVPGAESFSATVERSRGNQMLFETEDHFVVPAVAFPKLTQVVLREPGGGFAIGYGEGSMPSTLRSAFDAIASLISGELAPRDVDRLATQLRSGKHADPFLGVVCAYLYRAIADFDNIRRMAWFYRSRNQPVPYDIVLLGEMTVRGGEGGPLLVDIPGVPERRPFTPDLPEFTTTRTRAATGIVGGFCPWLAAGWDYVADPRAEWRPLVEGLAAYASEVARGGITVLPAAIGKELARRWRLREW